jgi:hypothetical protein
MAAIRGMQVEERIWRRTVALYNYGAPVHHLLFLDYHGIFPKKSK